MPYTIPTGTYSHGSLRPEDLLHGMGEAVSRVLADCPEDELNRVSDHQPRQYLSRRIRALRLAFYHCDDADDAKMEDLMYDFIEEVEPAFDEFISDFLPPYHYWGMHEGDGSDLGVWLDNGALADAQMGRNPDVVTITDPSQTADYGPSDCDYLLHVNDHGNLTLYRPRVTWDAAWEYV